MWAASHQNSHFEMRAKVVICCRVRLVDCSGPMLWILQNCVAGLPWDIPAQHSVSIPVHQLWGLQGRPEYGRTPLLWQIRHEEEVEPDLVIEAAWNWDVCLEQKRNIGCLVRYVLLEWFLREKIAAQRKCLKTHFSGSIYFGTLSYNFRVDHGFGPQPCMSPDWSKVQWGESGPQRCVFDHTVFFRIYVLVSRNCLAQNVFFFLLVTIAPKTGWKFTTGCPQSNPCWVSMLPGSCFRVERQRLVGFSFFGEKQNPTSLCLSELRMLCVQMFQLCHCFYVFDKKIGLHV